MQSIGSSSKPGDASANRCNLTFDSPHKTLVDGPISHPFTDGRRATCTKASSRMKILHTSICPDCIPGVEDTPKQRLKDFGSTLATSLGAGCKKEINEKEERPCGQ